jgi:hypothetical protein
MSSRFALIPVILAGSALFSLSEAKALSTDYQYTTFSNFSTSGTAQTNTNISFPRFNPASVPPGRTNIVLKGYAFYVQNVVASGTAGVGSFGSSQPGPFSGTATLTFSPLTPTTAPTVGVPVTVQGPSGSNVLVNQLVSGSQAMATTQDVVFSTLQVPNFTQPPATPQPAVTFYSTAWNFTTPSGTFVEATANTLLTGEFGIRYTYEYVPGPLPALGATAAFAWSRRLRRRISVMRTPSLDA